MYFYVRKPIMRSEAPCRVSRERGREMDEAGMRRENGRKMKDRVKFAEAQADRHVLDEYNAGIVLVVQKRCMNLR